LAGSFADEQVLKIEAGLVERHERVLSNGAHFEHLSQLAASLHYFEYNGGDDDFGLDGRKRDCDLLLLLGAERTCKRSDLSKRFIKRGCPVDLGDT